MTAPTEEPTIEQLQQRVQELEQGIRQAEVDCAYWKGRAEALEAVGIELPEPAKPAPQAPNLSLEKLLPLLTPLLTNPEILKLILPLLKSISAPRPADG